MAPWQCEWTRQGPNFEKCQDRQFLFVQGQTLPRLTSKITVEHIETSSLFLARDEPLVSCSDFLRVRAGASEAETLHTNTHKGL